MASPADAASDFLPNTVVGGSTGWTLKIGRDVATPDQIVVFSDSGGSNPNPKWLLDFPNIQVRVRGAPGGYSEAYAKAKQVSDVLLGIASQNVGSDRWVSVTGLGGIMFTHYDDQERPTFSVNFRLIIEPATSSLTNREALPG